MLDASAVKTVPNVLTREQCAALIAEADNFEKDVLKMDVFEQSKFFDKKTLDSNTMERTLNETYKIGRKVEQSPLDEPVFPEWDGNPVYRCKVMKYEEGDFLNEHYDAKWMCISNYWAPGTDKVSESLVSIALNDDYEGGEFTVEGEVIPQEVGAAIQVPCNGLDRDKSAKHGVKEVTKGTRYALVFWNFA